MADEHYGSRRYRQFRRRDVRIVVGAESWHDPQPFTRREMAREDFRRLPGPENAGMIDH
jgi:hypothetical protein